mmetsp:Transcript_44718/g.71461  ORF Transcript_44718/g.71461 Transcript_44718/m.71461 type:complete len:1161 (-) Transcript_44718:38-3520(-)
MAPPWLSLVFLVLVCYLLEFCAGQASVVTDETRCMRMGAPVTGGIPVVGCSWNKNVLEGRFMENSCEPSSAWVQAIGHFPEYSHDSCGEHSLDQCYYNQDSKCLPQGGSTNGTLSPNSTCSTPPLELLVHYLDGLVASFPKLYSYVEGASETCVIKVNNVTCTGQPECEWRKRLPFQVISESRPANVGEKREVQEITVMGPTEETLPQIQEFATRSIESSSRIVSLSLTAKNVSGIVNESYFTLNYLGKTTRKFYPTKVLEEDVVNGLIEVGVGSGVEVHVATSLNGRPSSWQITFPSKAEADGVTVGSQWFQYIPKTDAPPDPELYSLYLQRHKLTKQEITIMSNGEVASGSFILFHGKQGYSDETGKLSYDSGADNVRASLLRLTQFGERMLDFVAVDVFQHSTDFENTDGKEVSPWRTWNITYVSNIKSEYASGEVPLKVGYKANHCSPCEAFTILGEKSPNVSMTTHTHDAAPKLTGKFVVSLCQFVKVLPGLATNFTADGNISFAYFKEPEEETNNTWIPKVGDYVRVMGKVLTIRQGTTVHPEGGNYTLLVEPNVEYKSMGTILNNTMHGTRAHACDYTQTTEKIPVTVATDEFEEILNDSFPELGFNVTQIDETTDWMEKRWYITLQTPHNNLDPLRISSTDDEFDVVTPIGSKLVVKPAQYGRAPIGGTFRIAFCGYDGHKGLYEQVIFEGPSIKPSSGANFFEVGSGQEDRGAVWYTVPISVTATETEVKAALEGLDNIVEDGVLVERTPVITDNEAKVVGYKWKIIFVTESAELLENPNYNDLMADLPPLAIADTSYLLGDGTQVGVGTITNGSGAFFHTQKQIYFESAVNPLDSPCTVNETLRNDRILNELGLDATKLEALLELDENIQRCALSTNTTSVWNTEEQCKLIRYKKYSGSTAASTSGGENDEVTNVTASFCVWRGSRSTTYDKVDAAALKIFNWAGIKYGGNTGLTRNANCTVPILYRSQQLLKLFGLSEAFLREYEVKFNRTDGNVSDTGVIQVQQNQNRSKQLNAFIEQFNKCYEDVAYVLSIPAPIFIKLWQELVTFTSYTVALAYCIAGMFFSYRMRTFNLISPKSVGSTLLIVFGSTIIGGVIGFVLSALPSAVIFNIYDSIPHNLPFVSAMSLGIAQGIIILYFDLGRGIRTRSL